MANPIISFFKWAGSKIAEAWAGAELLGKINMVLTAATLAVGVKGFMQAKQMMAKGQDILANKTSAGGKLPIIYGTRRVGAQVIYMDVSANDSRDLYVVYALSVGECDEILGRTIELDGNPLTDSARFRDGGYIGSDKITSGNYSLNSVSQNGTGIDAGAGQFGSSPTSKYRYVMNLHHGAATQTADPMLVASMPNWTTAHKLNGVCYIAAHYGYDKEGIWKGVPQLTVQVRGKKVFDPRDTNQTFGTVSTYKYSDNPALTFLDYITNNEYGKGLTQSQINMTTFSSAANVCDTQVDQPYFNGSAQSLTWSGNAGDDFITIGGTDPNTNWWQNKVGEIVDINDANGNLIVDGKEIKDVQRNGFYDQNDEYIVYINDTLGSTYSSQTGSSLVKVKRFHCNGYLDSNKNVMDNAKELLANMRGIFLYINGKYELSIEDTGTSTFSINDNHIIADAGISVDYGNKDKKANKVIVEFFNANKRYELDTATVLHDATPEYYSDDGDEILEIKAEFPYISDPYIAYNMGKAILTRSRNQTSMQFLGTPEMYKLNVGDIVDLTYAGLGFSGKICRVEALELQHSGLVSVSLIEYFDVYTWEVPPQEPVEELANLPSAYAVKAPTGLSFTDSNASSTDRPFISWNIPTDFPDYQYRINVKDSSNNQVLNKIVDVNNADLNFLPTGTNYVASITSLNTLGTESSAATLTFTVGDAPVGLGDVQADVITANEINVTSLSAISADLGSITAGNMNIGSGNFTVSTAGLMTATGAIVTGEVNATSGTFNGSIAIGSGNNIFKADTNGIYLGNTSYASALFKVSPAGVVQSNKRITSGTGITQATLSGEDDTYRFWSGGTSGSTADFSVSKTGEIIAKKISIYNNEGGLIFSSDAGFSDLALTQISAVTGTPVQSVSDTFSANGDTSASWQSITLVANTNLSVSVALNTLFGGDGFSNTSSALATADALAEIPDNFTLQMQYSSDGGSNWNNIAITTGGSGNSQQFTKTTSTSPTAQQYSVEITNEAEPAFFVAFADVRKGNTLSNYGSVDANGFTNITGTITNLAGTSSGTTYKFRTLVTTTDSGYNTINKVTATAPRTLTITDTSGDGFYIDNGDGSQTVPTGDITAVTAGDNLNGGGTSGAVTLNLDSTISGDHTFSNNVVIGGNLDVQGTTTTIDTTNLDVKDKNITLNYGTGDTSANANGAGITIQDAVNSTTNATILWDKPNSRFTTSHGLNVTGNVTATGGNSTNWNTAYGWGNHALAGYITNSTASLNANKITSGVLNAARIPSPVSGDWWNGGVVKVATDGVMEVGKYLDFHTSDSGGNNDFDLRVTASAGALTVGGTVTATSYYGNGSNLTGVTSTTINNNADNRIITGSGTANTLNAESGLTYNGSALSVTGTVSSGTITSSGTLIVGSGTQSVAGDADITVREGNAFAGIDLKSLRTTGNIGGVRSYNSSNTLVNNLLFEVQGRVNLNNNLGIAINSTTFIDASRNLTNIGTISSGAITIDKANGTGAVVGMQLLSGSSQGDSIAINFGSTTANEYSLLYDHYTNRLNLTDGGSNVFYVAGGVVNFASAPVFGGGLTVPSLTVTGNGTIQTGAAGLIKGGYYQVGSTTVIDTSRNLTNVNLVKFREAASSFYASPTNPNTLNAWYGDDIDTADMWINYRGYADGFSRFRDFRIGNGKGAAMLHVDGSANTFAFINNSSIKMGVTTVIDASRNLTNIGTISSGRVTTSEDLRFSGSSNIRSDQVFNFLSIAGTAQVGRFKAVAAQTSYANSASSGMFNALNGYAVGTGVGTTVIDASRNMTPASMVSTNVGTTADRIGNIKIARQHGTNTPVTSIDNLETFILSKTDGGYGAGTKPTGADNSTGIISLQTHSGNYYTQLALSSATNDLFIRSAHNATSYGSYSKLLKESSNISVGTISSGAITSTGALTLSADTTDCLNFSSNTTSDYRGISFNGRSALTADYNDGYLRLNNGNEFSNGIFTPGNLRVDGGYEVNGTTVIDTSRNLTNIGTISSGAITAPSLNSTGTVTINSTGSGATLTVNRVSGQPNIKAGTDDSGYLIMDSSGGNAALNWYTSNNVVLALGGGNVGVGDNTPTQKLDVNGNIGIGGTEIITSSRNLLNIASLNGIAIGNIVREDTSNEYPTYSNVNTFHSNTAGASTGGNQSSLQVYQSTAQADAFMAFHVGSDYAGYFGLDGATNDLFWGGWSVGAVKNRIWHAGNDSTLLKTGANISVGTISSGAINTTSHITIGTISTTNTGSLFLAGSTANKKAELKCTNGNLHIDPDTANGLYLNYYKGTGGIFFGNGASSYRALMNTSGHLNLASTGASPAGYALAIGTVGVIDTSRNLTNIGTIQTTGDVLINGSFTANPYANAGARLRFCGGTQPQDYYIGTNLENVGGNYSKLDLRWHTGIRMGAQGVYGGIRFYNNEDLTSKLMSIGEGSGVTDVKVYNDLNVVSNIEINGTTVIDASRNITSSQLYIGSWTPSDATSVGRIGRVTDRPAGSITNQLGTNASSKWEIVDYDWTVVLASVTDAGNFTASGNVTAYSDKRLKTNIQTLDSKKALQMRGVSFIKDGVEGSGVIAQEVEKIAPELVITADDEMGTKSVAYGNLVGYLIEAIKDQQNQIDELKQRLDNDSSN